jgi:DNA-binding NtrC family response regulator
MPVDKYASLPIMIVDDEPAVLKLLSSILKQHGYENVITFANPREARSHFDSNEVAVAVLDLRMPGLGGQELLAHISLRSPRVPVIVVTADNQIEIAIDCMRSGAVDYLVKPVSIPRLLASVASALEIHAIARKVLQAPALPDRSPFANVESILTCSQEMKDQLRYLEIVSQSGQPVLITGETGVGKELFSRAVHTLSGRSGQFVCINVAGLDDIMIADTLFGHRKGAYTGAMDSRDGLVKRAADGTLFLDEIGDLSDSSQIKLLRLIQEGEYYPVGSDTLMTSRARIVLATNRDLRTLVGEGRFRKDLYYRLFAHRVSIPPLRSRQEDIPLLLDHFLDEAAAEMGRRKPNYRQDLVDLLIDYSFPGNVRELQAIVLDAVARSPEDRISVETVRSILHQDGTAAGYSPSGSGEREPAGQKPAVVFATFPTLQQAEDELVRRALELSGGNQGRAATLLGISRQALNKRLLRNGNPHS